MKKYLFLLLIISLGLWACVDEIKLNVDTDQRTVVVDGFVTDSLGDFALKLSESSVIGIGNDNILDPISGATIQLMDDSGVSYPYVEFEEGAYELRNFKALRGKAYYVDIVVPNGNHYQSKPAMLRASSVLDSVSFDVREESFRNNAGDFVTELLISTNIATDLSQSAELPFLRWRVSGEYQIQESYPGALNPGRCYVKTNLDINDIRLLDASTLNGGTVFGQTISETVYDFRFGEQFCFHISQYAISEEEFNYWNNIKEVIDIDGGLFDPPPGTVIGNIFNVDDPNEIPVGYFSVASIDFKRAFVNALELDLFVRPKCTGFRREVPFGCMNCLDITNSTREKPDYWEF